MEGGKLVTVGWLGDIHVGYCMVISRRAMQV